MDEGCLCGVVSARGRRCAGGTQVIATVSAAALYARAAPRRSYGFAPLVTAEGRPVIEVAA
jgi:hypothetical protein